MRAIHANILFNRPLLLHACCLVIPTLFLVGVLCCLQPQRALAASPAAFDCTTVSEIPQGECSALVALYTSTNGANWLTDTNWLVTNTPCSWYRITCNAGQVQGLRLDANQLTGAIPPALGNLTQLQNLNLSINQVTGAIPPELDNLTQLQTLYLNSNQLTGAIPELGNLKKLEDLLLYSNQLTGAIPPRLGNLTQLQYLDLGSNQLSGSIPSELANLTNLQLLDLDVNQLTGTIPPQLGSLTQLQYLYLNSNQLTGTIPPQLGSLTQLQTLYLNSNQLSGSIPFGLGNLTQLHNLALYSNQLSGNIPPELGNLAQLQYLYLSSNQLSGNIPPELGNLTQLQYLELGSNQLSGSIPAELGNLTQLQYLNITYNMLSTTDPGVITFLSNHQPDWAATQTIPPTNVQLVNRTATSVNLTWTPIAYQTNGGGYEVSYATQPGGPYTVHGIPNNKWSNAYTVDGLRPGQTYYFAVRTYTPAHSLNTNPLYSAFGVEQSAALTIPLLSLYVLALDSDLSTQAEPLINAIQSATATDANKVALLVVDRAGDNNTQILSVYGGKIDPVAGLPDPTTGQLNLALQEYDTANQLALGAFIQWARTTYPTPQTALTYVGHGVPLAPADAMRYISATVSAAGNNTAGDNTIILRPSRQFMTPGFLTDEQARSLISPYTLAEALRIGTNNGANPLTVLDIVHCFGGTIEEFYELANPGGTPFAEVMVGSPNYAYSGPILLNRALLAVQPGQSASTMAINMMAAYNTALHEADDLDGQLNVVAHPRVLVAVESSKIAPIKQAVDRLAAALLQSMDGSPTAANDTKAKITIAHQHSQKYDTTLCDMPERKQDWQLDAEDALSDLADFALQLRDQFDPTASTYLAANDVLSQLNAAIIGSPVRVPGTPWFASDPKPVWAFDSNAQGIAIYNDFHGMYINNDTFLGWQAHWYNKGGDDNPHPYAFVQGTQSTWSDVLQRFWQDAKNGVQTIACAAKMPTVRIFYQLYLPVIHR